MTVVVIITTAEAGVGFLQAGCPDEEDFCIDCEVR